MQHLTETRRPRPPFNLTCSAMSFVSTESAPPQKEISPAPAPPSNIECASYRPPSRVRTPGVVFHHDLNQ
ncbi:hypothetical protein C8Q70DRAFT_670873 [Cubamyces menziesii]|nr:hypothetical protein C8Q70DRAFT_670873 [Cubamyces menziesii]